jgi:hypothetical protein
MENGRKFLGSSQGKHYFLHYYFWVQAKPRVLFLLFLLKHLFTFSLLLFKCLFIFSKKMEEYTLAKDIFGEGTPTQGICGVVKGFHHTQSKVPFRYFVVT